ncbi:MAG: ornithine aminomutase subunit alpha [Actinobacteria bacterium]|nr:ornithine aminomutase subunit alpha [Actinomycetota bacterium]
MPREDDYLERRKRIANFTNGELEKRFWELANMLVYPLIELARTHTSPSIERSVLLRMGFSSLEAKAIVDRISEFELLGKGAGNVVLRLAKSLDISYLVAGRRLASGELIEEAENLWSKGG